MSRSRPLLVSFFVGLSGLFSLFVVSRFFPWTSPPFWPMVVLGILMLVSMSFGVALGTGVITLLPMLSVSSLLILGLQPALWLSFLVGWLHAVVRYLFGTRIGQERPSTLSQLFELGAINATLMTFSLLAGGLTFQALTTWAPFAGVQTNNALALFGLAILYLLTNHLLVQGYFYSLYPDRLKIYRRQFSSMVLFEAIPITFTPFIALVYFQLGTGYLMLLGAILLFISFTTHLLDQTRQRLERRVQELHSLQEVGQALSQSLEVERVVTAVYEQVQRLMPAKTFYIALYEADAELIRFPIFIREGEAIDWPARPPANGLTEYVMRTGAPLLVQRDLELTLQALGLEQLGVLASSWLGVPIAVGEEVIGVMSVQSIPETAVYDESHQKLLLSIANQTALALQNARLYASAHSSLAQRAQELDSIFRTTQEGILLFDQKWRVRATNRAFIELFSFEGLDPGGQLIHAWPDGADPPLITQLGFTERQLRRACRRLARQDVEPPLKAVITSSQESDLYLERSLTPVYNRQGEIDGWLIVLREITEEMELVQMREDMMHMLVHDLRAPLSVMMSSLEMIDEQIQEGNTNYLDKLVNLGRRNGRRMLRMISDLLDIYKLESGQVPLELEPVMIPMLLQEVVSQFAGTTREAELEVVIDVPNLPPLYVDYDHVSRVVYNLFDNAVKFTPDGGQIRLSAQRLAEKPGMTQLKISDTGPGIPSHLQSKVFQKFQHGFTEGERRKGNGLGLPYCRLVVEAHGGQIWVESEGEPGKGSTFVMRLPLLVSEPQIQEENGHSL